jgi:hypothetical protein
MENVAKIEIGDTVILKDGSYSLGIVDDCNNLCFIGNYYNAPGTSKVIATDLHVVADNRAYPCGNPDEPCDICIKNGNNIIFTHSRHVKLVNYLNAGKNLNKKKEGSNKMKTYCIFVGGGNDVVSEQVQKALFDAGFHWCYGNIIQYTKLPMIFVNFIGKGLLSYQANDDFNFTESWDVTYISAQYAIDHAHGLEGAINPKRTIVIDNKIIEISEESYQAFKKQFKDQ